MAYFFFLNLNESKPISSKKMFENLKYRKQCKAHLLLKACISSMKNFYMHKHQGHDTLNVIIGDIYL